MVDEVLISWKLQKPALTPLPSTFAPGSIPGKIPDAPV